jgi:chromate transport protein ChrA
MVPLLFREVVDGERWVAASVFMDGIALGQVTPGPIVITATFVGQMVLGVDVVWVVPAGAGVSALLMHSL